jgi:hypothetical protein
MPTSAIVAADGAGSAPDPAAYRAACREVDAATRDLRARTAVVRILLRTLAVRRTWRWLAQAATWGSRR